MTEPETSYGDALTRPYWEAARRHVLVVQFCRECRRSQMYPRPFCIRCQSSEVEWRPVTGLGTVYSMTTVRMRVSDEFQPPYVVAIVELDEGPRLMTNLISTDPHIGDRVVVEWRERADLPPLPIFRVANQ